MNRQQLNITVGSDVILNVTLVHEEEVLIPALIDNLEANLISGLGTRTALETGLGADYITINIPWVEGRLAGCHSLEVKGSINGLAWAAIGKGLIRYTNATEAGADSVTVEADAYDVTMEAGYHWTDSPIAAVHVSVDDEYGTPSADATYRQRVLGLDFHNLRGNGITSIETDEQVGDEAVNTITIKTDADPEGTELQVRNGSRGNGIASSSEELSPEDGGTNTFTFFDTDGGEHTFHSTNGKKGAQGDSVLVGQGDLPLAHVLGDSNQKTVSQHGITEVLAFKKRDEQLERYEQVQVYISSDNPTLWKNGSTKTYGCFVPVTPGKGYRLVYSGNVGVYAFLTTDEYTLNDEPSYASGAGRMNPQDGDTVIAVAPPDAAFMYVMLSANVSNVAENRAPETIEVMDMVNDKVSDMADALENSTVIFKDINPNDGISLGKLYINSSGKWAINDSTQWNTVLIPIEPEQRLRISRGMEGNAIYAFLSSRKSTSLSGTDALFAHGKTNVEYKMVDTPSIYIAPDNAYALYVVLSNGSGEDRTPRILQSVEYIKDYAESAGNADKGQYLEPVPCVQEYPQSAFSDDGTVIASSSGLLPILRRYALEEGKEYYATARLGAEAVKAAVAYWDVLGNPLSVDKVFDQGFAPRGELALILHKKLNVPAGAAYAVVQGCDPMGNTGSTPTQLPPCLHAGRWKQKEEVTPLVIEYHETTIRKNVLGNYDDNNSADDTEISDTTVISPWAVMWPSTYTPYGKPTQVIAMLHGAEGYVTSSVMGYASDTYKAWRGRYIQEGYAVVDINGVGPTFTGEYPDSKHYGCPAAVETLDKAFEFLKEHYNVADKLLIHGGSMGGALAQSYTLTYPHKVLAVGLFASVMTMRTAAAKGSELVNRLWGYTDTQEAILDDFGKMVGTPFCRCLVWKNGEIMEVSWSQIHEEVAQATIAAELGEPTNNIIDEVLNQYNFIQNFPVPIRCWQVVGDSQVTLETNKKVIDSYRKGNSNATLRLIRSDGTTQVQKHNYLINGQIQLAVNEAVAFFKRYAE